MMAALYYIPKLRARSSLLTEDDRMLINDLNNPSKQVEKLSQLLELPAEEYNDRRAVCTELLELLRKYYPDCLLHMFGSSVNGFGVRNCDLDLLFLPFPGYCNLDFAQLDKNQDKIPIPEPASILTGETSRDTLSKFDEWAHLKFVGNILRQEKTRVKKVILIPKPPSLKVYLSNSKIVCDLSASNRLVVFNSELLQFFEKLDARVKPLVLSLRFWAYSLGLLKRSFSNYAFTLLVIFFLQNVNPPILPSVKLLSQLSGFSRTIGGWQTAFTTDEKLIQKSKNTRTLSELMIQFFNFYWNFDFVQYVVCPFSGKPLPVKDLRKSSDNRLASFELSYISIQDPFILSHNVCKLKHPKIVFKLALFTAYQMLNEKSDTFKFSTLFDFSEYRKILDMHYNTRYMIGRPKVCFINLDYDCVLSLSKTTKNCDIWYEKASQAVFDVLEYGLLAECEVTDKISWDEKMNTLCKNNGFAGKNYQPGNKMDDNVHIKSTPYDLELLTSIQCTLYCRTWIGRKNVTEITLDEDEKEDFNTLPLKNEYEISREIIKKNPSFNSPVPLLCIKCDCYKHTAPQITEMIVMLKPLTFSKEFDHVSGFLASYIPKTVKRILASE